VWLNAIGLFSSTRGIFRKQRPTPSKVFISVTAIVYPVFAQLKAMLLRSFLAVEDLPPDAFDLRTMVPRRHGRMRYDQRMMQRSPTIGQALFIID
jgi:hypothetical protein